MGMNLANWLTLSRTLLIPVFLIVLIYGHLTTALILFSVAALTDLLDGFFARRLHQETALGSYLDPISDKLLMTVSFITLAIQGLLPAWLAVLVVAKDVFVSIGVGVLFFSGRTVAAIPTLWGKQTTFLQIITVALALLLAVTDAKGGALTPLFYLTGSITIFSGMHYILGGVRTFTPSNESAHSKLK